MIMRNWPHRSDMNRPRRRHRHKYTTYKVPQQGRIQGVDQGDWFPPKI